VDLGIGGRSMAALQDTGSDISLVSERAFNRMRPHLREVLPEDEGFSIGQADGQPLPILRRVLAPVRLQGRELARQEFWVVPILKAGVILGRDFLHRVRAVLDFGEGRVLLRHFGQDLHLPSNKKTFVLECTNLSPLGPIPPEVKEIEQPENEQGLTSVQELLEAFKPSQPDQQEGEERIAAREKVARKLWKEWGNLLRGDFGDTKRQIRLDVGAARPIARRPHRVSCKERRAIQEEMQKLESQGVIERTKSPWAAPVLMVRKHDGSLRPCVDYRELNRALRPAAYPVPNAQKILSSLQKAGVATVIDLRGCLLEPLGA
jgi:hypothetical protein